MKTLHEQLDEMTQVTTQRKWSPVKTDECPIEDLLHGGYCESDAQLRVRIKS